MIDGVLHDKWMFLFKYFRASRQIGSVTPSSQALAAKMVAHVPWDGVKAVAELGAGTGAITSMIRKANRGGADVLLFEKDPDFRHKLQLEYPEYRCCSDALRIREEMETNRIGQLDAIVSGLPFFNFAEEMRRQLLEQIDLALKPGGLFVAFQYSLQMKAALSRKWTLETIYFVLWNLPPAFVYVCRKGG
ncbi:phospholipid methyltransferase [Gordoniibacillus kamchatkensis]|uniref:Phospholipid methyltransferase n=1 Tax=Gordoniibacillus kamchatkensis TaxID=1590651 RepID=A0ABR5ABK3_9BACL|nr:methyltransferase [Paenibacillus sp. VKM B-2647]KIL38073.1 phospholipid methyltransferase [Paenibacillus sp. VKM B-2647]